MALSITSENLQGLLDSGQPLVIDFWAEWCGPCRMVAPLIDELAAEYAGRVTIGKCDVDENNDLAVKFAVRNIPTILFIKGGQIVDKQIGACPKNVLVDKVNKIL
ncbi:MAG TPA: thioredoxin [Candidatus Alistipes merdigallinarum]|nr:thioredoxin [Candidatus Alistipes merdigallinarum]